MPIDILMPALSPTMTEGNLAKWLKKEGDAIRAGDVLCEIETDKATMEVEAVDEGILEAILVPGGTQAVKVNAPIARLRAEGDTGKGAAPAAAPRAVAAPATAAGPAAVAPAPAAPRSGSRIIASPLARRLAAAAGLDLTGVAGSGPRGRIIKHDVTEALARGPVARAAAAAPAAAAPVAAAAPAAAPPVRSPAGGDDTRAWSDKVGLKYRLQANSGMRKVIARRLTEAKQTIPHFYLSIEVALDAVLKIRADLNARSDAYKLSVNDFVIRAVALALRKVPAANAAWTDENILLYDQVDLSVAVATPAGLITPIIKAADAKGLAVISAEMKDLAARARDGKLKPEEFQGGTFTISNLGMFGIREFSAIINPPQACILAVGAGEQRPVVRDGALAIATAMTCTLSIDHRVVDGAVGAAFLAAFKKLLEDPLTMLL
ncbi:MAG: pyruvate dehydrogenase complex dihydrolipoamide acetyltransferase [Rhodospirillaceae bacterium]